MTTYKLFRTKGGKLFPLYVEAKREIPIGEWLEAGTGEQVDATHVRASGCGGKLSLRPGWHSTSAPWTDWIGQKGPDGKLYQRANTVWCECTVEGDELHVANKRGLPYVPEGWYLFRTNSKQIDPWVISKMIRVNKILTREEVETLCKKAGLTAQPMAE